MIDAVLAPWLARWDALDDPARRQATLVGLSMALFLVHYAWYSHWFIEDAAISFAYARYLAEGEGLVPFAGGELVEGFSNPTWTLLLAAQAVFGITPWVASKLSGALLGLVGLPFAWWWARQVLGPRNDLGPAFAALLLAISPQYTTWAASGLENSVMTALMASGGALLLHEIRTPRRLPWSGLLWGLLSISRPEAPVYAAIAGVVGIGGIISTRGWRGALDWTWRWGLLSAAPFFAWHVYAFVTFAWELPNTYFAKLHDDVRFQPWHWSGSKARSWGYLRRYAQWYGHGWLLWLYLLGQSGFRGLGARATAGFSVLVYLVLLPGIVWLWSVWGEAPLEGWIGALSADGSLPLWPFAADPEWMSTFRILFLLGVGLVWPVVGWGRPGAIGRTLAWWLTVFALFFAIYAGGDWMDGVRWMNLCCVPLTVLLVDAVFTGLDRLDEVLDNRTLARALAAVPLAVVAALLIGNTVQLISRPDTSPYNVRRRVLYGQILMDRLDVRRPVFMDVDMGAHQWFAGPESHIVDVAGLIDIPMGHHKWQEPFILEYVFDEQRPHLAHLHGGWARRSKITAQRRFREEYLGVTDFPVSVRTLHIGNHVRKDLVFPPDKDPNPARQAVFQGGFGLADWEVPAPRVQPGGNLTVKVWWQRVRGTPRWARPVVFLSDRAGRVVMSKELPPAYDWLEPGRWMRDQIARGTHRLTLPRDLPEGSYDLGFVVLHRRGAWKAMERPDGAASGPPVFARGEVRWTDVVEVVDAATLDAELDTAVAGILAEGDCLAREQAWDVLRHTHAPDHPWRQRVDPQVEAALATCFARALQDAMTAAEGRDIAEQRATWEALGRRARWWDHRPYAVGEITRDAAYKLRDRSETAERDGDLDLAYDLARIAMELHPTDAWARRRTERLRDARLGVDKTPSPSTRLFEALGWGLP